MICSEQIESFKANGYLVMPGFIDSEQIEEWRDQFWSHLGCTLAEPEKWPEKVTDFEPDPIFGNMPELQSIARQVAVVVWRCVGRNKTRSGRCRSRGIWTVIRAKVARRFCLSGRPRISMIVNPAAATTSIGRPVTILPIAIFANIRHAK